MKGILWGTVLGLVPRASRAGSGRTLSTMLFATAAFPLLAALAGQATLQQPVPPLSSHTSAVLARYDFSIDPLRSQGVSVRGMRMPWPAILGLQQSRLTRSEAYEMTDLPQEHHRLVEADLGYLFTQGNRGGLFWVFVGATPGPEPSIWLVSDQTGMAFSPTGDPSAP